MAEEALKKLEEQLNCAICLDTYTDPKLLQCFHVYCRKCLVKLVVRDQQGQLILTCPICRQITPIPANGVAGLQPAFHINELFDIVKEAKDKTATVEKAEPHPTPPKKTTLNCSEHDREFEFYCETCGELICSYCPLKGRKHHSHEYDLISSSFGRYKGEMTLSLEAMEKQLEAVNRLLTQLDTECGKISDQRAAIEAAIHNTIKQLQEALDVRKTELIGQLHQLIQNKLKRLATQRDQVETIQAQLSSCLDFVKESLKTDSHGEVLKMKTTIEKRVKELTSTFQPDALKPTDVTFSTSPKFMSACQNYGQVYFQGSPDPSKCHIISKALEVAEVGKKSTALLQVINYIGEPCEIESLECELVSEIRGTTVRGSVEKKGHSQYEISYQPTIKGRHQLHIKVNNQPISGSPFAVRVKLPIEKLGTPISTISGLKEPWGVAVNQSGKVVITELDGHCVSIFSPRGEKLHSFGTHGSAHGQFDRPHSVAVDGEGNILVADTFNDRIQKFTPDGQFLTAVGTRGSGHLQFEIPDSITFNPANNDVYVAEWGNHHVQVLNSDLTFSSIFGREGSGKGQLNYPRDIACDSTGNVYVADAGNHRIQVFTTEGKFLRVFGKEGQGRGELSRPSGVAVDTSGRVYISESGNHRVSVFTSEGQYPTSFGREGSESGEFRHPRGLTIDSNGVMYVCDTINNVVQFSFCSYYK